MEAYDYKCKQANRFDKVYVVALAGKSRLHTCKLTPWYNKPAVDRAVF